MRSDLPKISIITPSYNQAPFIEETIQSVLDQEYPFLEYIVMDGGSTDGTVSILKKYDHRITWISEKDRGQSHALNKGFQMASGDVLAYLNSDDRYEPGALLRVGNYFASHSEAYWVTGRARIIDTQGREIRKLITVYKNIWLWFKSYKILLVLDYISQPATFWRKTVIDKIGLFDEEEHLAMDYDYSLRVGQHFGLDVINSYLAAFRVHSQSKSNKIREHFNCDLVVARRYSHSQALFGLHRLHNELIIFIYESWYRNQKRPWLFI